ncbi:hypothetical protein [Lacticaseibacillus sp. N501-2]|uniref:hypothetical protein n=1 Tax=Lacticaseibacillus salsurae TaxID=3367729 RepID=UPI0038B2942D
MPNNSPLNDLQCLVQQFINSPLPDSNLPTESDAEIQAVLDDFIVSMYMHTGKDLRRVQDVSPYQQVLTQQLDAIDDSIAFARKLMIIQVFVTACVQPYMSPELRDEYINWLIDFAMSHQVNIDRQGFDEQRFLKKQDSAKPLSAIMQMVLVTHGIAGDHDGGYALLIPHVENLDHPVTIGRYTWVARTAKQAFVQGFRLAERLRKPCLLATQTHGMDTAEFIALMVDFYAGMYLVGLETVKRWSARTLTQVLERYRVRLAAADFRKAWQVVSLAITTLCDDQTLTRKQGMALIAVVERYRVEE